MSDATDASTTDPALIAALVERARSGDTEAFAELIVLHQRMIHALTYRLTGSEADAADLAQFSTGNDGQSPGLCPGKAAPPAGEQPVNNHGLFIWRGA